MVLHFIFLLFIFLFSKLSANRVAQFKPGRFHRHVQPRTRNRMTKTGMGTPNAHSKIQPTFPFSFFKIFIFAFLPLPSDHQLGPTASLTERRAEDQISRFSY
jgi:hypothetical protein